jgi:hypothetical protein
MMDGLFEEGVMCPDTGELRERAKAGRPFGLVPMGDCPYCHAGLERRVVRLPEPLRDYEVFSFWQCTNDRCCLMFWRRPRAVDRPLGDDAIEH